MNRKDKNILHNDVHSDVKKMILTEVESVEENFSNLFKETNIVNSVKILYQYYSSFIFSSKDLVC